jgi:hypothetical protein
MLLSTHLVELNARISLQVIALEKMRIAANMAKGTLLIGIIISAESLMTVAQLLCMRGCKNM